MNPPDDGDQNESAFSSPTTVANADNNSMMIPPIILPKTASADIDATTSHDDEWKILSASTKASRTSNPIRAIVDPIVANIQNGEERGDGKDHISLALGDPTAYLPPCPVALSAIRETITTPPHAAGYIPACGLPLARMAIARHCSSTHLAVTPEQVIVANGCSGALELALTALLDDDSVLLIPQPGFPLYQVITESHGASVVHYRLLADNHWQIDLGHLQELVAEYGPRIRGIVVNNPSNPTGAVFSWDHLEDIVQFCDDHHLAIVSDEVYGDLTFGDSRYYPLADVAASLGSRVPVIAASGIGKQYLLPGWRVGWIVFHDNIYGSLRHIQAGANRLAQVILGASHLAQSAVPKLLERNNPLIDDWKAELRVTLEKQATFLSNELSTVIGFEVLPAQGAMYTMIRIDTKQFLDETIRNDVDFCKLLLEEENVFVLPGACFGVPHAFRVVFCAPVSVIGIATSRIRNFCQRHVVVT